MKSLGAAMVALGVAAMLASAQSLPPTPDTPAGNPSSPDTLGGDARPDSEFTPTPKDGCQVGWQQVAGVVFPDATPCSPYRAADGTRVLGEDQHLIDFYTVSFLAQDRGFAGGAMCKDKLTLEELDALKRDMSKPVDERDCPTRVPVIWEYARPASNPFDPPVWREVYRGAERGFVAAIDFVDDDGANWLAVGGDGVYPRREIATSVTADDYEDPAGRALAWHYSDGRWSPLTDLPGEIDGLTALDFSPRNDDCGSGSEECGFAGGLGAVWMWKDGSFRTDPGHSYRYDWPGQCAPYAPVQVNPPQNPIDPITLPTNWVHTSTDPPPPCIPAAEAPFRVRAIRFRSALGNMPAAVAVTSGCCYDDGDEATPRDDRVNRGRIVEFTQTGTWRVRTEPPYAADGGAANTGNSYTPDSLYAFSLGPAQGGSGGGANTHIVSAVASPGGPERDPELASRILGDGTRSALVKGPEKFELSSLRLVAGDSDLYGARSSIVAHHFPGAERPWDPNRPDGIIDWAVGELRSSGRAAAFTTLPLTYAVDAPDPLVCPPGTGSVNGALQNVPLMNDNDVSENCKLDPGQVQTTTRHVFRLPSYRLNAFATVGTSGVYWTVGDRGAIFTRGSAAASAARGAPLPPTLGAADVAALPDHSAFDPFRPLSLAEVGTVPPLAERPMQPTGPPGFVPAGAALHSGDGMRGGVRAIVMSRDGSEGWALGPSAAQTKFPATVQHFDGQRWTDCDAVGVPGVLPPDRACAGVPELKWNDQLGSVRILTAARVPLELGSEAALADDFEVVAIAARKDSSRPKLVLRYSDGRWAVDRQWTEDLAAWKLSEQVELAFAGPHDAWLLDNFSTLGVYRLVEGHWIECQHGFGAADPHCDDPRNPLLPMGLSDYAGVGRPSHFATVDGRVYVYGTRSARGLRANAVDTSGVAGPATFPYILYRDPGDAGWKQVLDPSPRRGGDGRLQGCVASMSVARNGDRTYSGWAIGTFTRVPGAGACANKPSHAPDETPLLRLGSDGATATTYVPDAASAEYLNNPSITEDDWGEQQVLALPGADGEGTAVAGYTGGGGPYNPLIRFDLDRRRWEVVAAPWGQIATGVRPTDGRLETLASDGAGGFWVAVEPLVRYDFSWFEHYTSQRHDPVFSDVAHPVREPITAAAAGGDGSLWVSTASDVLYRYDRIAGWDRIRVRGWDAGRVVTNPSPVHAVAIGPDGSGVAVGKEGRIADLSPRMAVLDRAAGVVCQTVDERGCGTAETLRAAAVAADGSAFVGGDNLALLWRPAGGQFRPVSKPLAATNTVVTGIAMPRPDRAWMSTGTGAVFAGSLAGNDWTWVEEVAPSGRRALARTATSSNGLPLRAVAVDDSGHGFAVGDGGVVLERSAAGAWRRMAAGYTDDLRSIALGPGGKGALIGGEAGLVLTLAHGHFAVARPGDYFDPLVVAGSRALLSKTVAVALLPGTAPGQVEAWAAIQGRLGGGTHRSPTPTALLHYASDPDEPLLGAGQGRARPLPDSPAPRDREVAFAAFGKSDCHFGDVDNTGICPEHAGSTRWNDVLTTRVRDELIARAGGAAGPRFALFTGDVNDTAGWSRNQLVTGPTGPSAIHDRWVELVADPLREAGLPIYGAIGGQDLSLTRACPYPPRVYSDCTHARDARAGANRAWRRTMLRMAAPWGRGAPGSADRLEFAPVPGSSEAGDDTPLVDAQQVPVVAETPEVDESVEDPAQPGNSVGAENPPAPVGGQRTDPVAAPTGGANTHYAFDVKRAGEPLMRVVVVDTSLRSLAGSDPAQSPAEEQLKWLGEVLSSRPAGARAVVVSNTPTYSYGPGATSDTMTDATTFETVLMQNGVDLVVSGRLGWNGRYWAHAPGVHEPCPGGVYQDAPAGDARTLCQQAGSDVPDPVKAASGAASRLAGALRGLGAPEPPDPTGVSGQTGLVALPFVVAASAGGKFGPNGENETGSRASDGYWHGYTIVRVSPSGDFAPIVEQRPVFDWIGIQASQHALRPGQKLALNGYGREPVGSDVPIRYDEITGPVITHRWDLLEADPRKPWLPRVDPALVDDPAHPHGYVQLDPSVATIDEQSGRVIAQRGAHGRVFAIAVLSVGDKAASWPLVFEPKRSYVAPRQPALSVPQIPEIRVLGFNAASLNTPTSTPPSAPPPPINTTLNLPNPPALPNLPGATAPPVAPPVPPAPPAPPGGQTATPIDLSISLTGLTVPPTTGVTAQPTPPVNPSPPGGARKEAKQHQASAAKSEEGSQEGIGESVDLADSKRGAEGAQMTRRDRIKPAADGFTPLTRAHAQPSAWTTGLEWGGGIGLMALALALGFTTLRPTPRGRRQPAPDVRPAPAYVRQRRRY